MRILSCLGFSSLKIMFSSWSMLFHGAQLARVWMCGFVGPGFCCPWLSALHAISLHDAYATAFRRVFAHNEPGLRQMLFQGRDPWLKGRHPPGLPGHTYLFSHSSPRAQAYAPELRTLATA